jgi:hypothetical protein
MYDDVYDDVIYLYDDVTYVYVCQDFEGANAVSISSKNDF